MKRLMIRAGLGAAMLFAASPAFTQGFDDRQWWMSHWGWGHMFFGGFMMIAFWGGIILIVALLARSMGAWRDTPSPPRRGPIDILQERFAKGEIDQKEYEERRQVLENR
jgi:putative membrane protein